MVSILYYDLVSIFKREFYKELLTLEHLSGPQIKIDKMSFPGGEIDENANFWGYTLEKNGKKYLLSSKDKDGNEIDLKSLMPIFATNLMKVATRGVVYYWIKKPVSAKIKPEEKMSFKEMIDRLCGLKHSNTVHQKLMWFMTFAQMYDRANFRISTPAGFGKDSTVDIIGNLIGGACTIENPTLAKLEFMSLNKLLAVNEVVGVGKSEWRTMEQFLLAAGAHKPEITKHSRAVSGGVKEVLDISKFSLSLMYNDIDHYPSGSDYFDKAAKQAVKDRFPPLRLYGTFQENFNEVKNINQNKYVKEHWREYVDLIATYTYFKGHIMDYYHNYSASNLDDMSERWKTNIGRLLKMIDIYCDSQAEFDEWVKIVNEAIRDYAKMLEFPKLLDRAHKELTGEEFETAHKKCKKMNTFIDKTLYLERKIKGETPIPDGKAVWEFDKEIL